MRQMVLRVGWKKVPESPGKLFYQGFCVNFDDDLIVNEYAAAMFTGDDFLTLSDLQLYLGRDDVKTSTTSIPANRYDSQAVAISDANLLVGTEQAVFNVLFGIIG